MHDVSDRTRSAHTLNVEYVSSDESEKSGEFSMRGIGYLFYIVAIAITVLVVASKYFGVSISPVTAWVMRDSTASLLAALVLSLISRWL